MYMHVPECIISHFKQIKQGMSVFHFEDSFHDVFFFFIKKRLKNKNNSI